MVFVNAATMLVRLELRYEDDERRRQRHRWQRDRRKLDDVGGRSGRRGVVARDELVDDADDVDQREPMSIRFVAMLAHVSVPSASVMGRSSSAPHATTTETPVAR